MATANQTKAAKLAQDLDAKIDDFVDSLPKKLYTDGLTEENWEEEIEKIPAFMTKGFEDGVTSTAIEALQALKYDEGTPEEIALSYKDDGNDCFKKKKYKMAAKAYKEGLKQGAKDGKLNAILYTNKAAAEYHLGNYRSSLKDAMEALKIRPDHVKALLRCIECSLKLELYSSAIQWCDQGLKEKPTDVMLQEYRSKAEKAQKIFEKEKRKRILQEKKERAQKQKLLQALKERNVNLVHGNDDNDDGDLSEDDKMFSMLAEGNNPVVYLDEEGALIWPVRFMYPEHATTELIEAFNENTSFEDHDTQRLLKVNPHKTLRNILSDSRLRILLGTPAFIVLVDGSEYEKVLLQKHNNSKTCVTYG
ncbi:tetratricopeptide repeat protein 4-like [Anneissia japonica]|uniref:tetratricopeptide repeat protein 4-like n=1 Tax=Anneissia japonica TaxID=1529436 RepID=UPI0014256A80|nr:tetratricopeptide repeat protein 4-like [Anneissia japonica]